MLFSEGVSAGRIDLPTFVRLTSTNAARLFGLAGRKGTLAPGADADLVLWNPDAERVLTNSDLHHAIDYTPWEGMRLKGLPTMTIRRGEIAVREGQVLAAPGSAGSSPAGPTPSPPRRPGAGRVRRRFPALTPSTEGAPWPTMPVSSGEPAWRP